MKFYLLSLILLFSIHPDLQAQERSSEEKVDRLEHARSAVDRLDLDEEEEDALREEIRELKEGKATHYPDVEGKGEEQRMELLQEWVESYTAEYETYIAEVYPLIRKYARKRKE